MVGADLKSAETGEQAFHLIRADEAVPLIFLGMIDLKHLVRGDCTSMTPALTGADVGPGSRLRPGSASLQCRRRELSPFRRLDSPPYSALRPHWTHLSEISSTRFCNYGIAQERGHGFDEASLRPVAYLAS